MSRVLFQNRAKDMWVGGDFIQLERTREVIERLGYKTGFSSEMVAGDILDDYDIVHTFNFSMPWTSMQMHGAWAKGKKNVCSMIYHEREDFVPYDVQQKMADITDIMIFQTEGERARAERHLKINRNKTYIIPNGIESWWFIPIQTVKQDIALTVGRIEPFKNQLSVAKVCRQIGIPYICIGEIMDRDYGDAVLAEGAIILPAMKREDLKKLYAICKVFVMASQNETWSLVVDEAGSQSANIVLTEGCERTDIPNVERCNPNNILSIRFAIDRALKLSPNIAFRTQLKTNTWDSIGEKISDVYKAISQPYAHVI